jgi:hypothetical protein
VEKLPNSGASGYDFNVELIGEDELNLYGVPIRMVIFEPIEAGEIIKVCTGNHILGISAEYAWIDYKYPGYKRTKQSVKKIKLNGKDVKCDILTIEDEKNKKDIFFDISDFYSLRRV